MRNALIRALLPIAGSAFLLSAAGCAQVPAASPAPTSPPQSAVAVPASPSSSAVAATPPAAPADTQSQISAVDSQLNQIDQQMGTAGNGVNSNEGDPTQ